MRAVPSRFRVWLRGARQRRARRVVAGLRRELAAAAGLLLWGTWSLVATILKWPAFRLELEPWERRNAAIIILFLIAALFMRNQVRALRRLADPAQGGRLKLTFEIIYGHAIRQFSLCDGGG